MHGGIKEIISLIECVSLSHDSPASERILRAKRHFYQKEERQSHQAKTVSSNSKKE